jgi:arabinofuranosyltransferase
MTECGLALSSLLRSSIEMSKLFFAATLLAATAMLLGTAWMGDDAFITLRVIDNFVNGYGLRYNVIERVQVFTHPLWLLFLTPFYALTREALVTTMLVSVFVSLAAFWLLGARVAKDIRYGSLLVLAAVASRTICQYATSGLETPLTFLLLALFMWQLPRTEKKWVPAGIIGLLLLNRLDLAVLLGPMAAYLFFQVRERARIKVALAAFLPALGWMVFSLIFYGMPFPNTAYAKLGTGYGTGDLILRGLEYAKDFALHDPLLLLIIGKAVFDAGRSRDRTVRLLGAGIVLHFAYTIAIGGDFMSGRFFAAPGFLSLCLLARMPVPSWIIKREVAIRVVGAGVVLLLLLARVAWQPRQDFTMPETGISDEQHFYYADTGLLPVIGNWLTAGIEPVPWQGKRGLQFRATGQQTGRLVVISAEAIGMRGYYGGPMVHVIDEVALADAFLARLPAIPGSRVGHYRRVLPAGYVETITSVSPETDDEALRPLLNDVVLATRAPLFAEGRWGAIWRLLGGHYVRLYESDRQGAGK